MSTERSKGKCVMGYILATIVGVAFLSVWVWVTSTWRQQHDPFRLKDLRQVDITDLPTESNGEIELTFHIPQPQKGLHYVPATSRLKIDPKSYLYVERGENGCAVLVIDKLLRAFPTQIGTDSVSYWIAIEDKNWVAYTRLPIRFEVQPIGATIINLCVTYGSIPEVDGLREDRSIAVVWNCHDWGECESQFFVSESFLLQSSWQDGLAVLLPPR